MRTEQQQLLIKDICARLPYGVIANYILFSNLSAMRRVLIGRVYLWSNSGFYIKKTDKYSDNWTWNYETWASCEEFDDFKPYLRPMSSMTEDERKEYDATFAYYGDCPCYTIETFDFLNKYHFDHRGLIPMGLALPAPDGMYDFK